MPGAAGHASIRPDVVVALRRFSAHYVGMRRASGELRTKLVALLHERERWEDAAGRGEQRARRELEEVERLGKTLERSARACAERTRAIEAVIAAVAGSPAGPPRRLRA